MSRKLTAIFAPALALGLLAVTAAVPAEAQQHKATRLGNPATRFAKPLKKPDDARVLLRAEKMKADVAKILAEVGWAGDPADLERAAATAEVSAVQIAPGTRLPFMASRKNGKPYALKDVLWAGSKPIDAFAFEFTSKCRRYRLVVPKACSNFWVEDLGADTTTEGCVAKKVEPPVVELNIQKLDGASAGYGTSGTGDGSGGMSVSGASTRGGATVCVTEPVDLVVKVLNPPADQKATLSVNGNEVASGTLSAGTYRIRFPGRPTPGRYEVKGTSGGRTATAVYEVVPCVPTCSLAVNPIPAFAGKPITVDASRSAVARGVTGGVRSVKVEVVQKGEVVQTVDLPAPGFVRNDVVIKKGGPTTVRAVVTDEAGQASTNTCSADLEVKGGPPLFVGGYFGKERLCHDDPSDHDNEFTGCICSPAFGVAVGFQPMIGENVEFEAALGLKFATKDDAHTSLFVDAAVNRVMGRGFFGGGLSWWDVGKDSGGIGPLVQGGYDLTPDGKWQLVGQGRLFFSELDDIDNNYQLWGGIRFRPNSWK
jgi:hypothetical protein